MRKIKFEGSPPYALPIAQNVTARAEGVAVEMTLDSARSLRAQLQPAITMAEVHQRR
jgi:hypothetical protein